MFQRLLGSTLCFCILCQSIPRAEDPLVATVAAGLETLSDAYSEGEFEFQSAIPSREAHDAHYKICSGTYRWKGERVLVKYSEWDADSLNYQLNQRVPGNAQPRVFVANKQRRYHWYPDRSSLFIVEAITKISGPEGIDVGPHRFWLTLDGQFDLQELLSKVLPQTNRRWVTDYRGDEVRIGMGKVGDDDNYYEFSFLVGDQILPTGYERKGTELPNVVMRGEVKWHVTASPPSVAELKFFAGSSLDELKIPRIAFSCSPISLPSGPESDFDFDVNSVPDGTLVNHARRPGVPAHVYRKGNVAEVEGATEKRLRVLADEIRGK